MEELYISGLELQRWPPEFVFSFSEIYVWDLGMGFGLAHSFWGHEIQILFRVMHFQDICILSFEKL
jgi:hypothetical protein